MSVAAAEQQRAAGPSRAARGGAERAVAAASSVEGVPFGTELGRAPVGERTIVFSVGSDRSVWCADAASGQRVGLVSWRPGVEPRLHPSPDDRLGRRPDHPEARQVVACASAVWRAVFSGDSADARLRVTVNPAARATATRHRKESTGAR